MLPYATAEEALGFANVNIITNSSSLLYIINISLTTGIKYDTLLIKIRINHVINELSYSKILKDNGKILRINGKCKDFKYLQIAECPRY